MYRGWWFLGMYAFWWVFGILVLVGAYRYAMSALKRQPFGRREPAREVLQRRFTSGELSSRESEEPRPRIRIPLWLGLCLFLAIALFFLLEEHRAHILGAVPYVLLLLCPIIHMLMHRHHGPHGQKPGENAGHSHHQAGAGGAS